MLQSQTSLLNQQTAEYGNMDKVNMTSFWDQKIKVIMVKSEYDQEYATLTDQCISPKDK